jgi:hypothetical protein
MSRLKLNLPDKIFGATTNLLLVWVTPVLVITVLGLTFFVVIGPKISEIREMIKEVKVVRQSTLSMVEKRLYFSSVDQEELNANANLLNSGVMSEKNSYLLVKIIQRVAEESGYQVSDFSVSLGDIKNQNQTPKGVDFEKIPVQLVLSGPRQKYLNLILGLERNLPVLSIDSFDMKTSGEIATIEINVSAYFQPESAKIKMETLNLKEMTLLDEETKLLSKIKDFKAYGVTDLGGTGGQFKSYERNDPFFTP